MGTTKPTKKNPVGEYTSGLGIFSSLEEAEIGLGESLVIEPGSLKEHPQPLSPLWEGFMEVKR